MERSAKRGKIPQQDWPLIIARYEAGETLASIARTYDCSPPAISYILNRSRERATAATPATAPKTENISAVTTSNGGLPASEVAPAISGSAREDASGGHEAPASAPRDQGSRGDAETLRGAERGKISPSAEENETSQPFLDAPAQAHPAQSKLAWEPRENPVELGEARLNPHFSRPPAAPADAPGGGPPDGEARRTLHLSHGSANGSERNGDSSSEHSLAARLTARRPAAAQPSYSRQPMPRPEGGLRPEVEARPRDPAAPMQTPARPADEGIPRDSRFSDGSARGLAESPQSKEGGSIDRALRDRVHADTAAFLTAFDAALADDTAERRADLRAATDRLLRASARTRIELERLEARLPLPPRDKPAAAVPSWRQR
jgi:hypothetical protein